MLRQWASLVFFLWWRPCSGVIDSQLIIFVCIYYVFVRYIGSFTLIASLQAMNIWPVVVFVHTIINYICLLWIFQFVKIVWLLLEIKYVVIFLVVSFVQHQHSFFKQNCFSKTFVYWLRLILSSLLHAQALLKILV